MRQSYCPLLATAAVLLLGGFSITTCAIPSDERLLTDEVTLVDLPELDGTFLFWGEAPFEIIRLGGGQYEYRGPVSLVPDLDRITPAETEALAVRYRTLGLPEPEQTSSGGTIAPPALEPQLHALEALCGPLGWYDGRRCARLFAELLEPDYPGVVAFEDALAALPTRQLRERLRFSLHRLEPEHLVSQSEEVLEMRLWPIQESEEPLRDGATAWRLYFWEHHLVSDGEEVPKALYFFETLMIPYTLALLRPFDDGSFAILPVDDCLEREHLDAYGFKRGEAGVEGHRGIVAGPDADIVGMLNACFPENPSEGFRFWKIDAPSPGSDASAE
jgi:hypothetical protein